jgi:N-methylhydantoinase B
MAAMKIDPITLEVVQNGLLTITKEMDFVIARTARSVLWQESGDYSTAILAPNGDMISQGPNGIPVHLGTMPQSVQNALAKVGVETLEPGDVIWNNDPYSGSNHVPDVLLVKPIFYDGAVVAISAVRGHWLDIGGSTPGSYSTINRDIYGEGFRLPPTKLFRRGVMNEDLFNAILANVRLAEERRADFEAQMAGLNLGERRVMALCEKYGRETFSNCLDEILRRSEALVRLEIRKMPNGVYRASDILDGDEIDRKQINFNVTVTIRDEELEIDFSGTDPQATGGINASYAVTCSATYYTIKTLTNPEIPANSGSYRPIKVIAPEGTVVNPIFPAPVVQGNHETGSRVVDVLYRAFAQAIPDKVIAGVTGSASAIVVGGETYADNARKKRYLQLQPIDGGRGACVGSDGINAIRCGVINAKNQPIEIMESRSPIVVDRWELAADSGGAGQYRGGCAVTMEFRIKSGTAIVTTLSDRGTTGPYGLFGGEEGRKCGLSLTRNGTTNSLFSKSTVLIEAGDVFRFEAAGGGGVGNPLLRDPDAVIKDVKNGYVTVAAARTVYGLEVDPQTLRAAPTPERRAQEIAKSSDGRVLREAASQNP